LDQTEKKGKSTLVRLGQNEGSRKLLGSPRSALASPLPLSSTKTLLGSPKSVSGLHSFKTQRDLSLGANSTGKCSTKPLERKKFVPNLNVQRIVKKENDESDKVDNVKWKKKKKENKHERRDKNTRDKPTLIQTGSIFSEGIGGDALIRRRSAGYGSRDESANSGLVKPKLTLNSTCDREAEELKLKSILRDDFIDDLKEGSFVPVQLPMIDTGNLFKSEMKQLETGEDDIKPRLLNLKKSGFDSDTEDDPSPKCDDTEAKPVISRDEKPIFTSSNEPTVDQLLKQQTGQLLFFQLPDSIPIAEKSTTPPPTPTSQHLNISNLGYLEGKLGKLQIRKSGRCQLVLGREKFDVETGTKVGFLQDVVSVRVPSNQQAEGELTILGHVSHRLVLSPDWDSLLKNNGLNNTLA